MGRGAARTAGDAGVWADREGQVAGSNGEPSTRRKQQRLAPSSGRTDHVVVQQSGLYDDIGRGYTANRREDPRIANVLWRALDDAQSVLNVGPGASAYEPAGRHVLAVESSNTMIAQRPFDAGPCAGLAPLFCAPNAVVRQDQVLMEPHAGTCHSP